jgi:hypothetical protein
MAQSQLLHLPLSGAPSTLVQARLDSFINKASAARLLFKPFMTKG